MKAPEAFHMIYLTDRRRKRTTLTIGSFQSNSCYFTSFSIVIFFMHWNNNTKNKRESKKWATKNCGVSTSVQRRGRRAFVLFLPPDVYISPPLPPFFFLFSFLFLSNNLYYSRAEFRKFPNNFQFQINFPPLRLLN